MKQEVKIGQEDYTVLILIRDSTTGAPKTALTFESAGIDVCYTRVETDNDVVLTAGAPVTTTLTGDHVDWGFVLVDDTNAPGIYKLDIADGVFAAGAWSAVVSLICTGCDPVHIEFTLVPESPYTGVSFANIFGTALTAQIAAAWVKFFDKASPTGTVNSLPDAVPGADGGLGTTNGTKLNQTVDLTASQSIGVSGDFSATMKTSLNAATPASVQNIPVDGTLKVDIEHIKTQDVTCAAGVTVLASVGTAAASTAQTGDSYAIVNGDHGLVSIQDDVDAIKAKTDKMTYTSGDDLDVNVQKINDAALTGDGTALTPWGPA